jgi:hypothetical protein
LQIGRQRLAAAAGVLLAGLLPVFVMSPIKALGLLRRALQRDLVARRMGIDRVRRALVLLEAVRCQQLMDRVKNLTFLRKLAFGIARM